MIVKVQIPLSSNSPGAPALLYNRDKSVYEFLEIDNKLKDFMGGAVKKYFHADKCSSNGQIILRKPSPVQGW